MNQDKKLHYLKALEIDIWVPRQMQCGKTTEKALKMPNNLTKPTAELSWEELETRVKVCQLCDLHKSRTQTVFGVGNNQADLLIVGEAPGANEDKQGEPFVGRAGRLLNAMLQAIGLSRQEIYIANILKSRPPNNRDPLPEEVAACIPYLHRQIALIKPKLMLAVGRIAAHHLLATNVAMGQLRGKEFTYGAQEIPLIITYHPAYLLRSPREKRKAWDDMRLVTKRLNELKKK
jgi:uracil-DNA glycosylase family 4